MYLCWGLVFSSLAFLGSWLVTSSWSLCSMWTHFSWNQLGSCWNVEGSDCFLGLLILGWGFLLWVEVGTLNLLSFLEILVNWNGVNWFLLVNFFVFGDLWVSFFYLFSPFCLYLMPFFVLMRHQRVEYFGCSRFSL